MMTASIAKMTIQIPMLNEDTDPPFRPEKKKPGTMTQIKASIPQNNRNLMSSSPQLRKDTIAERGDLMQPTEFRYLRALFHLENPSIILLRCFKILPFSMPDLPFD